MNMLRNRNSSSRKNHPSKLARLVTCGAIISAIAVTIGAGASSASPSSSLASVKAFLALHSKPPAFMSGFSPIEAPVPKGKTIDYMVSDAAVSVATEQQAVSAAKALGWTVKAISTGATPATIAAAMATVAANPPDGVITTGNPSQYFQNSLDTLFKDKVPVVDGSVPTAGLGGFPIIANVAGTADYVQRGQYAADYIVAHSDGKANTVLFNVPDFPILNVYGASFVQQYKKLCPLCKVDSVSVALTAIGTTFASQAATYLLAHPKVNYALLAFGGMATGVPTAMKQAGVKNVFLLTDAGGPTNYQYIKSGQQLMDVSEAVGFYAWDMMDALARYFAQGNVSGGHYAYLPREYISVSNLVNPASTISPAKSGGPEPLSFQATFKKLWHVK